MNVRISDIGFPFFQLKDGLIYVALNTDDMISSSFGFRRWFSGMEIVDSSWTRYRVLDVFEERSVGPLWGFLRARFIGRKIQVGLTLKPLPKQSSLEEMQNKVCNYVFKWTQYSKKEKATVRGLIHETRNASELAMALRQSFTGELFDES